MKKLILFLTLLPLFSFAQERESNISHEVNFMILGANDKQNTGSCAANYIFSYRAFKNFGIGAGTGYEWSYQYGWLGGPVESSRYGGVPVFLDLRYDIPICGQKLFFTGVLDTGIECGIGKWRPFNHSFIIMPQIGLKIKLYKSLHLNVRGVYRYLEAIGANSGGVNLGLSF